MDKLKSDRKKNFRLTQKLLDASVKGAPQAYFVKDVLTSLMSHSQCSRVALRLEKGDTYWCERDQDNRLVFGESSLSAASGKASAKLFTSLPDRISLLLDSAGDYKGVSMGPKGVNLRLRLKLKEQTLGLLALEIASKIGLGLEDLDSWNDVGRIIEFAFQSWRNTWTLQERVKEISCLYGLIRALNEEKSLFDQLSKLITFLPPAMLYANIASARIGFDDLTVSTPGFRSDGYVLKTDIMVRGVRRGEICIAYSKEKPALDEGPFLKEERKLLDIISQELAWAIERQLHERKRNEILEQLQKADQLSLLGQLAGYVAHEVNEPLTTVLGFAQLAAKTTGLPEALAEDLRKIAAAAMHAREIIRKPLLLAGVSSSEESILSLNEVVREMAGLFQHRCAREGVKLNLKLDQDIQPIEAGHTHLRQIISNLILNAIQATPTGGAITLQTFSKNGHAGLIVKDTGAGMAGEVIKQVFTPFFTTKPEGLGTGLGLPVVKDLVTSQGGCVKIQSQLGRGTSVMIRWPAVTAGSPGKQNT